MAIVLFSMWMTYVGLTMYTSPLRIASQWMQAVAEGDIIRMAELMTWEGEPIDTDTASRLLHIFRSQPQWLGNIYTDLQREAQRSSQRHNEPSDSARIHFVRDKWTLMPRLQLPSVYVTVLGEQPALLMDAQNKPYVQLDEAIGPLRITEPYLSLVYQSNTGTIIELIELDFATVWEEEVLRLLPTTPFAAYTVTTNVSRGDLFIDNRYAGPIHRYTYLSQLSYDAHALHIERNLPWGAVKSETIQAYPSTTKIELPLELRNDTLLEQLGESLVRYNESWVEAARRSDPKILTHLSPAVQKVMSKQLLQQQGYVYFDGYFVQVWIDPTSVEIRETAPEQFEAKLRAREDYANGRWVDAAHNPIADFATGNVWEYHWTHTPSSGWLITDIIQVDAEAEHIDDWRVFHSGRVLRIGVDAGLAPFETIQNGQLHGFDIDIIRWLGERLGVTILLYDLPWDQLQQQFVTGGTLDGAISAIPMEFAHTLVGMQPTIAYYDAGEGGDNGYVLVLRNDLQAIVERINDWIVRLHTDYIHEYNAMKDAHF